MTEVWGRVPISLLNQDGLSLRDIKVYIAIASFQGGNGTCHPSVEQISSRAHVSSRNVYRAMKWLEQGWLDVSRCPGKRNEYHVHVVTPDSIATPADTVTPASMLAYVPLPTVVTPPLPTAVTPILKEHQKNIEKNTLSFDQFWKVYPRKVAKRKAAAIYASAIKRGVDHAAIMAGVSRYLAKIKTDRTEVQYIAHPTTWLTQGRWEDEEAAELEAKYSGTEEELRERYREAF